MNIERRHPVVNEPDPESTELERIKRASNRPHDDAESQGNRTRALAGLVVAVVLLVIGLWLARELTAASKMQDCLMSGRTNCNVIQPQ
jgi:hypothetical protein